MNTKPLRVNTKTNQKNKDTTGAKRLAQLRERMVRMPEVHLTPESYAEVEAMISAGESRSKTELIRQALHEKYLRWVENKG